MAVKETPSVISFSVFTASKHIQFLSTLKRIRFSGQLVLTGAEGQKWLFFLYQGQLIYATGGVHPVRRWQRILATYCPQLSPHRSVYKQDLAGIDTHSAKICWQYQLLSFWSAQQKITYEQVEKIVQGVIAEVLFDVAQARQATSQIQQDTSIPAPLVAIDIEQAIAQVEQLWYIWRNDRIANCSPNLAPVIRQPEQLGNRTSLPAYQALSKLLDGKHTLRDLATQMKRDIVQVTRSLMPYLELGIVELVNIPDLPAPVGGEMAPKPSRLIPNGALVACVDDSPLVCQTMEKLLIGAGYRYVGVTDGMRAIATLLARKPQVIFLDLVMPNTNGYEICTQLRKLACFQNTPIIILTGNDGLVDRVRAKLTGASDFLSKPIDAGVVLSVLRKHLEQGAVHH